MEPAVDQGLQIVRGGGISQGEWISAICRLDGIRIEAFCVEGSDLPVRMDQAAVRCGGRWAPVFRWVDGRVLIVDRACPVVLDARVRQAAAALARELRAVIFDGEGIERQW
jgi:hypothetical protein